MKELTLYYRQIKRWLPCGRLYRSAGTFRHPQKIAAAFVDEMDTTESLSSLLIRRRIVNIILTCVIVILAIWVVAVLSVWCSGILGVFGFGILEQPIVS